MPVVWGWLPDKKITSYKVFFLLLKKKMEELGFELKIKSVISDFEINIMKSVDDMLKVDILGCFFHLKKTKVDKKGMKTRYESDDEFRSFVNKCSAIAHLPPDDNILSDALDAIDEKYQFPDEKAMEFKVNFLNYIREYWIRGCYPTHIWSCWSRSEDITNNNQVCDECGTNLVAIIQL